ncbi:hypothetical protein P154DRAFT_406155, partial [Amniculicola lignicola CBS 123094]
LMDTSPGGEQTQYEGEASDMQPHNKLAGQMGQTSAPTALADKQHDKKTNEPNTQGVTPADKIRYGQSIQEGGVGGKTTSSSGQANQGGFGGTEGLKVEGEDGGEGARRKQGYGGRGEMSGEVG